MGAWGNHDAAVIKTYLNSMIKGDSDLEVYVKVLMVKLFKWENKNNKVINNLFPEAQSNP